MNILKYTRDQMQHRKKQTKKKRRGKKTHTSDNTQSWKIHTTNIKQIKGKPTVCTILLKMDLCRNVFSTTNQDERNKTIKMQT